MDALFTAIDPVLAIARPYLTPISSSLPAPVADFLTSQVGPTCYATAVEQLNLTSDPACSRLLVSKLIGTAIVGMSAFVKIPQLLKLLKSRSARGVSFTSYLLETLAYTITIAYNFRSGNPVSTFGEIVVLAIQNVIVGALVLEFQGKRGAAAAFVAGISSLAYLLFDLQKVPVEWLQYLQALTIPLGLMSKVPQIWTIASEKSTGQLSAFAVFNYLFGSMARIFTTMTEVDDPVILSGFILGATLNVVIASQMVYYWNSGTKLGAQPKKVKAGRKKA